MGKRSKSGLGSQIKEIQAIVKEMTDQYEAVERLLKSPRLPANEKRALRVAWNKALEGTWFERPKPEPKRPKSSQAVLSSAIYLKEQARLFAVAGRSGDARRLLAEAVKLEAEGKRLRAAEQGKPP